MEEKRKELVAKLCLALLYLITQFCGGIMVRHDRPRRDPSVIALCPFFLVARDRTGEVGEITTYVWYGFGVFCI